MKYFEEIKNTVESDELLAGVDGVPVRIENYSVKGGADISRGMILASSVAGGVFEPVKAKADAEKVLVISAENGEGGATETKVLPCYVSGSFHQEKISTGASVVSAADFKEPLRKVDIVLAHLEEVY